MKIERMNKGEWGKVRAFFDLRTEEGFVIKGFKIIEGINGLFVSMPSQKGKEDEYFDTVWVEKDLRDTLNKLALDQYNSNNTLEPEQHGVSSESLQTQPNNSSNAVEEKSINETDAVQPFSEDDIPF